jgi:threonine synthase
MGFDLALQLGFSLPDVIVYPTGGGTGLIGMWKAFAELEALGLIGHHRPRMVAVQASGCAPIVHAFAAGERHAKRVDDAHTIASGIRVPAAIGDFLILDALRESGGFAIAVDDPTTGERLFEHVPNGLELCAIGTNGFPVWRRSSRSLSLAKRGGSESPTSKRRGRLGPTA